jgi:hypothetical protein
MRNKDGTFGKGNSGKPKGAKNRPTKMSMFTKEFIGSIKLGTYYVYYHINPNNKEVFYIGKGRANRAWSFGDNSRNDNWHKYVELNEIDDVEVRLVAVNMSEIEALAIEKTLIQVRQPCCNLVHNSYMPDLFYSDSE